MKKVQTDGRADERDVAYGPHERNRLDLYRAKSDRPTPLYMYMHGGGFKAGGKRFVPVELLDGLLDRGVSVASIIYRLSPTDPFPAAMHDGARALQYLRCRAADWNLDPERVAAGGDSAGGGIAFWLGYRPDRADPASDDPVARQSTRLQCVASWNTQSSYDPNYIRKIIPGETYAHPVLQLFFRKIEDDFETPEAKAMYAEASALDNATAAAPPTFVWYPQARGMPPDLNINVGIHNPVFGEVLKEKLDSLGVECVIRYREDRPAEMSEDEVRARGHDELAQFVSDHLQPPGGTGR